MQPVAIEKHEPERRRKTVTTLCGCCCSCCCCCLHTVGSIVGAALAPTFGSGQKSWSNSAPSDDHWTTTYGVPLVDYWDEAIDTPVVPLKADVDWNAITSNAPAPAKPQGQPADSTSHADARIALPSLPGAVAIFWWTLSVLIVLAFVYGFTREAFLLTAVALLLLFPLLQLASAFVTLIVIACWPRPDKSRQLKQLAKITAGVVLGSLLGIGVMLVIALFFGFLR